MGRKIMCVTDWNAVAAKQVVGLFVFCCGLIGPNEICFRCNFIVFYSVAHAQTAYNGRAARVHMCSTVSTPRNAMIDRQTNRQTDSSIGDIHIKRGQARAYCSTPHPASHIHYSRDINSSATHNTRTTKRTKLAQAHTTTTWQLRQYNDDNI